MGAIPVPPKKTLDEHRRTQAAFLRDELEPVLAQARARGLMTRGRGDQIYLGPPLVSSETTIDRIVVTVAEAVEAVLPR